MGIIMVSKPTNITGGGPSCKNEKNTSVFSAWQLKILIPSGKHTKKTWKITIFNSWWPYQCAMASIAKCNNFLQRKINWGLFMVKSVNWSYFKSFIGVPSFFTCGDGHQSMDEMTKLEEYPPKDSHEMDEMGDDLKMTMVTMVTMVTMLVTV